MADRIETRMIPVDQIHPNPDNPRHSPGNISGLTRSINEEELLQPILVIPAPQFGPDHVVIEDGFRRWMAGKGVRRALRCQVRFPAPEENRAVRAIFTGLVTDAHKEALKPMEKAEAYGRLRDEFGLTLAEIAKQSGLTTSTIGYYLTLLELSDKSKDDVRTGKMSADRAVSAVREHRKKDRVKKGQKPVNVGWEPDAFNDRHHLNKKARTMCVAREHSGRRRFAGACHACWETVIRQDQSKVDAVEYGDAGLGTVPFVPPIPITPDGAIRTNATPNGIHRGL
jgi:ParB family transcriptional regulator, chromosome partitioning protein